MSTHEYITDSRNKDVFININGELMHRNEAKVSVFDSGFLLGDGVWEGIRYHHKRLVHIEQHFQRLFASACAIGLNIGKSQAELEKIILDTLEANHMESDVHIRFIVTRGLKSTPYQHPKVNIGGPTIVVIPEYKVPSAIVQKKGIRLGSVSIRRGTTEIQDPRWNTLSKINCIVACIEADRLGYDEALMMDVHGYVSTCNSTNFFIVRDNEVWTSTGEYCLNGVTRGCIIRLCKENDIPVFERNFILEDCYSANEAFVTGTFAGVIPVVEIDRHEIADGKRGKITEYLQLLYQKEIDRLYPPND